MRPVQFFKNNADHRPRRNAAAAATPPPPLPQWWGNFCFQELWLLFCKNSELSMMTGEAKKKARLACNPLLGPWTLQGVTAYKAKHTYTDRNILDISC